MIIFDPVSKNSLALKIIYQLYFNIISLRWAVLELDRLEVSGGGAKRILSFAITMCIFW